jgi:orotate phosphoribosyltransferase
MSPAQPIDQDYKSSLLSLLIANNALAFGTYTLKSGRQSPYFLTSSRLYTAPLLRQTSVAFANVISSPPFVTTSADGSITSTFDIVFGYGCTAFFKLLVCLAID